MSRKLAFGVLLVCPLALFLLSIFTTRLQGPFFYGQNSDPEYAYLLNGLNIVTLQAPGHTDHPGTTLQVIDGAIILSKWAVGKTPSLRTAVLTHPEDYLHTIGLVLNLLLSASLYFAARRIYKLSDSLLVALVFQIGFGMYTEPFHAQARVSPEPLLVTAALLLFIPAAGLIFDHEQRILESEQRLAVAIGLALAFGMVTKITFAPLLAVCLLFRTWKSVFVCLSVCCASAIALLFPVWTQIPRMVTWFGSLLIHKERYGAGPLGFPSAATLVSNAQDILNKEPMLFLFPAVYAAAYIAIRRGWLRNQMAEAPRAGRLLLAGILVIAVQLAITLKHFASHYLLPAMLFTMLVNAKLIFLFSRTESAQVRRGLYLAALLVLAAGARQTKTGIDYWTTFAHEYLTDTSSILARRTERKDCTVIDYYRASSQTFALSFGDDWTNGAYERDLAQLYPAALHYNPWTRDFYSMRTQSKREEIRRSLAAGSCYLMQGSPLAGDDLQQLRGFTLTPLLVVGHGGIFEGLYRLGLDPAPPPR